MPTQFRFTVIVITFIHPVALARRQRRDFRASSQAATCPPVDHTRYRLYTVPLIAERKAGKLKIPILIVFGLTRPGIEPSLRLQFCTD